MEDKLGTFLVKLSNCRLGEGDSRELTKYLHIVSDFERISDQAVNILFCAREKHEKNTRLSEAAWQELGMRTGAIREILSTSDHCSNVAVAVIEISHSSFDTHEYLHTEAAGGAFKELFEQYSSTCSLDDIAPE